MVIQHLFLTYPEVGCILPDTYLLEYSFNATTGVLYSSLILCFMRDVLPRSVLCITNILVYSSMRSHTFFWSCDFQTHNSINAISSKSSIYASICFCFVATLTPTKSFLVSFSANIARMAFADEMSGTAVCLGKVICLALWFVDKHLLCLPQVLTNHRICIHGNMIWIACNWLDNQFMHFECIIIFPAPFTMTV